MSAQGPSPSRWTQSARQSDFQAQAPPVQPPHHGAPLPRQPSRYSANRGPTPPSASNRYRQQSSVNRQRSLTRPERQRPRPGMVRSRENSEIIIPPVAGPPVDPQLQQQRVDQKMRNRIRGYPSENRVRKTDVSQQQAPPQDGRLQAQRKELQRRASSKRKPPKAKVKLTWWAITAQVLTCCCPNWCLKACMRKKDPLVRQAWREKLSLVYIILFCCLCLAFLTFGMRLALCPEQRVTNSYSYFNETTQTREKYYRQDVSVYGILYPYSVMQDFLKSKYNITINGDYQGVDFSPLFDADSSSVCNRYDAGKSGNASTIGNCHVADPYGGGGLTTSNNQCIPFSALQKFYQSNNLLSYDWMDLHPGGLELNYKNPPSLIVLGDSVLNITAYLNQNTHFFGNQTDTLMRNLRGQDASYLMSAVSESNTARACLAARYTAGVISSDTMGCIADDIIVDVMLAVIICLIVVRFTMAVVFQWFIAGRLTQPGGRSGGVLAWRSVAGGNADPNQHRPPPENRYALASNYPAPSNSSSSLNTSTVRADSSSSASLTKNMDSPKPRPSPTTKGSSSSEIVDTRLHTIMLVTCYSEGHSSLKTTLDSLAVTTYSRKHKIFFIIADGIITGSGNKKSTPQICIDMLDLEPSMEEPKPCSYIAIADGEKQLNAAQVYAGHYKKVPVILIVKCGTTAEQKTSQKPGNRGKRDSQLILMSFLQRVLFNDRLTELDYEIFWKMTWLTRGVTPDKFELVLMVDADTKVAPKSLTYMVAAMVNDITIMGLCGETRIANKRESWVTAIQVFEYYISHHYSKAFESAFGGVTCLPGCFCMYRIKAPKNGAWVPILANPDIVLEYNQNVVTTLHAKNLLLLGEDRFLSTLMLRTFPKRQMMFVPQAKCKTVVPNTFSVLLSQRRRWINSTVHNLMELVLVSDLCGIACLSMQFVVTIDLIGTIVLPAAICFTIYLIVITCVNYRNPQFQALFLLAAILGLPALLIVITTRKVVYIGWMVIYLFALPIWNFVLPVYSFWHFDDFTWGQTRKVAGEKKERHGVADGEFDSSQITMKKWEDWERERLGRKKIGIHQPHRDSLITPTISPAPGLENKGGVIQDAYGDRRMFGTASRSMISSPISYRPSSSINVPPSPRQGPMPTGPRYSQPQPGGGSPYLTATTVSPQAPIAHRLSTPNLEERFRNSQYEMQSTSSFNRPYSSYANGSFDDPPVPINNSSRSNLHQGSFGPESSTSHPLPQLPYPPPSRNNDSDVSLQDVITAFDRNRNSGRY
ncbi:hypothetical protein INT44_004193 [Umbelopsis vinacea]|uniref:chitin synthase n=1 Tax=Umbelopsis vinacea TaxID=44442 RepID=A0A8H7UK78_9FUNG|nr:hypothetical protein INT44_004193 [Umbelopsis vinacea]